MKEYTRTNWEIREDAFRRHLAADESSRGDSPRQINDPESPEYMQYLRQMYPVAVDLLILFQRAGVDLVGVIQDTNVIPKERLEEKRRLRGGE